jgi:hypothetical protein
VNRFIVVEEGYFEVVEVRCNDVPEFDLAEAGEGEGKFDLAELLDDQVAPGLRDFCRA